MKGVPHLGYGMCGGGEAAMMVVTGGAIGWRWVPWQSGRHGSG